MELSAITLKNLEKLPVGTVLRDPIVRPLYLTKRKTKSTYTIRYLVRSTGRERRLRIGIHPYIPLIEAREIAQRLLSEVVLGGDPALKHKRITADTIGELAEIYLTRKKIKSIGASTRLIRKHVIPELGHLSLADITVTDIRDFHNSHIATPYQANRLLHEIRGILKLAEESGLRSMGTNPCQFVKQFKERPHQREITPTEARRIAEALEATRDTNPRGTLFILMLIYSGARPGEIAAAKWGQLTQLKNGFEKLSLAHHKTEGVIGERQIYFPPIITDRFPVDRKPEDLIVGPHIPKYLWQQIRKRIGAPDLRLYDLRHWFASVVVASGHSIADVGVLYQHTSPNTSIRYVHGLETRSIALIEDAVDYLKIMMGN